MTIYRVDVLLFLFGTSLLLHAEFQRIAKRDKKDFLSDQGKEIEENNRMGKTRDLSKKIRVTREHFTKRWAQKRTAMVGT